MTHAQQAPHQPDISRALRAAARVQAIEPFRVMEIMKAASAAAKAGVDVISMSVGEPDFTAPELVTEAAVRAIRDGATQYTDALGLPALREAIAGHYRTAFGVEVDPRRVIVTAGASAGLLLACAALVCEGDEVLMPDPSYPCNRHFVSAFGGKAVLVPSSAEQRYQLTAELAAQRWTECTRGIIVASPSNPTGTSLTVEQMGGLLAEVRARDGFAIVDEIYQGLSYDHAPHSALRLDDHVITVNSFSKYFNMTGWRLGWLVVPEQLVSVIEKLAQNLFICPSTVAQHAALACFHPDSIAVYEQRRLEFKRRRDFFVPALRQLGFGVPVMPDGAFYVYADCSGVAHPASGDSSAFVLAVLREAGVAFVPGDDFGVAAPHRHVRFSYATAYGRIEEAVHRMGKLLNG
jgi:aspartate/methionine/tyrosine aminotransferase